MGTDIHTALEIQVPGIYTTELHWEAVPAGSFPNPYFDPNREPVGYNTPTVDQPYSDRNYTLFAFLADVRNGRGFAGVDTGNPIKPIDDCRGVPEDAHAAYRMEVLDDSDLHSATWYTLAELVAADWDQPITTRGLVPLPEYLKLRDAAAPGEQLVPDGWIGGIWGGGTIVLTPAEYEAGDGKQLATKERVLIQLEWTEPLRERLGDFIETALPRMIELAPLQLVDGVATPNLERARLLMSFDN